MLAAGGAFPAFAAAPKRTPVAQGGTNLGASVSGGVLGATSNSVMQWSAALTANAPVLGGGAGAVPTVGSRTGNTTLFGTASGAFVSGNCVQSDASHNLVDAGVVCGGGGGSGTVTAGTINQLAWYAASGTAVAGLATANSGLLVTSAGGVPSIATTTPSGLTIPSPTLSAPALGTIASGNLAAGTGYLVSALGGAGTGVVTLLGQTASGTGGLVGKTSPTIASPTFTGTAAGAGTIPGTLLVSTAVTPASYGTSTSIPSFTVDQQGRITAASSNVVVAPAATLTGATLSSGITASSLLSAAGGSFTSTAFTATGTTGATVPLLNASNTYSGVSTFTGSLNVPMRLVTGAGAITVSATTDYFICVKKASGAATAVNLPATPGTGKTYLIKDCKGDAASNNITVTPNSGTIDGAATAIISTAYGSLAVTYNSAEWSIN